MRLLSSFLAVSLALVLAGCASGSRKRSGVETSMAAMELTFLPLNFSGEVHVDFNAHFAGYGKIAVLPFKAAVDIAGQSVPDIVTTELFKTSKYELIERGQIESVLKEQEFRLSGVIDEAAAVALGRVLGVQGVVIGTLSEYGLQRRGISTVPSVGMSIRMIDTTSGKIVWSVSHSLVGFSGESLSQVAQRVAEEMITALSRAWIDMGDRTAPGLPPPREVSAKGGVREVVLEWPTHTSKLIAGYEIQRRNPGEEQFVTVKRLVNQHGKIVYTDTGLLDLTQYAYRVFTVSRLGLISAASVETDVVTLGPPAPPISPTAQSGLVRAVELVWSEPADANVVGYVVKRRDAGVFKDLARLPGKTTTRYMDQGGRGAPLEDGKVYSYVVTSFNYANIESEPSVEVQAQTLPPPAKVTGLTAQSGLARAVALHWEPNPEEQKVDGYKVFRSDSPDGSFVLVGRTAGRLSAEYTDSNRSSMKDNTPYYYQVAAFNYQQSDGALSDVVRAVTRPGPPPASGVHASKGGVKSVEVSWSPSPGKNVERYRVHRAEGEQGRFVPVGETAADVHRYQDGNLRDGQEYRYQVTALDADQLESDPTEPVTGGTKPAPAAPVVTGRDTSGGIELAWKHDDPGAIEKYVVYELGFFGRRKLAETVDRRYVLESPAGKRMRLVVTAVDRDGLESSPSETVTGQRSMQ